IRVSLAGTIPSFTLRKFFKVPGKQGVSSCHVNTLHLARRVADRMQRTMRNQSSSKSGRRASNKFLAKIASDWRKPDGLFVIQPDDVDAFLSPLPVGRLPGVGKVTGEKLA